MNASINPYLVFDWEKNNLESEETLMDAMKYIRRNKNLPILLRILIILFVVTVDVYGMFVIKSDLSLNIGIICALIVTIIASILFCWLNQVTGRLAHFNLKLNKFHEFKSSFLFFGHLFDSPLSKEGLKEKVREHMTKLAKSVLSAEKALERQKTCHLDTDESVISAKRDKRVSRTLYDMTLKEGVQLDLCHNKDTDNHFDRARSRLMIKEGS